MRFPAPTIRPLAALLTAMWMIPPTPGAAQEPSLPLGTVGIQDPWIAPGPGPSGALRQGWLGLPDGFFTRAAHLAYAYADSGDGEQRVTGRLNYPLRRRLWVGAAVPVTDEGRLGDAVLTTSYMLYESARYSVSTGAAWRLPTGDAADGDDVFAVQPRLDVFADVGAASSVRGRIAWDAPDGGAPDAFVGQIGYGRTFAGPRQLSASVGATWRAPTDGAATVSVTPAARMRLHGPLFFLLGVELPVTQEDDLPDARVVGQFVLDL